MQKKIISTTKLFKFSTFLGLFILLLNFSCRDQVSHVKAVQEVTRKMNAHEKEIKNEESEVTIGNWRYNHKDVQGFIRIVKKNEAYTAYLTFDDGSESKIERLDKKYDLYHLSYSRFNEFYRINHEGDLNVHYRNKFVTKCKVVE